MIVARETNLERDIKYLAVKEQQDILFSKTGQYTQIKRNGEFDGGLGVEQLVISDILTEETRTENYEIHVYEAPCGKGFIFINYFENYMWVRSSTTELMEQKPYEDIRIRVSGCLYNDSIFEW